MKIPLYERRNSIPGPDIRTPHATADAFGAQVGAATAKLGQTLASTMQSISSDFKEYQDKADASNAGFALSDAETTATVEQMKAENETPPDQIGGYAERRRARDNEIGQEMLAKVPQSQQQRAQLHWRKYSNNSYERSYKFEQNQSEGHWASRIDEQAGKSAAALENAPEDLAAARLRLEEQIAELPRMPDWKKRQLLGRTMPILVHGAMQGYEKKLDPIKPEDRPVGRARDDIILQMQNLRKSMDEWGTDHDTRSRSDAESVVKHARNLGISPRDYAAVISKESGFDKDIWGGMNKDGSGKGTFLGLIQMSPENQRKYNVKPGMTFDEQMVANSAYLRDRGLKPGMGLAHIYSIINAGSLDKSGEPRWDRGDANAKMPQHVADIAKNHYPRADKFLGEVQMADAGGGGDGRVQLAQAGGAPVAGSVPMAGGASVPGQTAKERAVFNKQMDAIIERSVNKANAGDAAEKKAVTESIVNDTAQLKMTGKDSELNAIRVERAFGPQFAEQWNNERQAARDFHSKTVGMEDLSEADMRARVQSLLPQAGAGSFALRAQDYTEANKKAETILTQRKNAQEKLSDDALKIIYDLDRDKLLKPEHVELARPHVKAEKYHALLNLLKENKGKDDPTAIMDLERNMERSPEEFSKLADRYVIEERITTGTYSSYIGKNRTNKKDDTPPSPYKAGWNKIFRGLAPDMLGQGGEVYMKEAREGAIEQFDAWHRANKEASHIETTRMAGDIVGQFTGVLTDKVTLAVGLSPYFGKTPRVAVNMVTVQQAEMQLWADMQDGRLSPEQAVLYGRQLEKWQEILAIQERAAQTKPAAPASRSAPGLRPKESK